MGLGEKIAGYFGYVRPSPARATGFAAADVSRLTSSLRTEAEFINTTLRYQGRILRARSRQAAQNNPFARRFVSMVMNNVAGPNPFRLQSKIKYNNGKLDVSANRRMEDEWRAWGKMGACELSGRFSLNTLLRLLVRTLATDGELLARRYRGKEYGRHGYKLQIIDVDRLDDQMNKSLPGGGAIHMGVEVDALSRPVAYHILKRKPSQWAYGYTPRESDRVPAEDIIHRFIPEFAEQVRGVPWMYAALLNLVHLGAFEEAAVIAARVGAAQMGFIQSPDGTPPPGSGEKDAQGNPQINAEPGSFPVLPQGYQMMGWNPKYPDAAIGPFVKACLRGIAAGVDVAYHNISGDMEGVNYSSARIAELDERDAWMTVQNFFGEHVMDCVHADWLETSVLTGALPFDPSRLDKYREIYWQAKRWAWVDPEKEVDAAVTAINNKLKSRTRVIAETGDDIEDVFSELAAEEQLATDMKIDLPDPEAAKPAAAPAPEPAADDPAKALPKLELHVHEGDVTVGGATTTVTVPERQTNVALTLPELKPEFKVDVAPAEVKVSAPVSVTLKTYPSESTETFQRDGKQEITRITRKNKD